MSRTISTNYPSGLTLTNAGDNPVYIAQGVSIVNGAGAALINNAPLYWSITNGTSAGIGGYSFGVSLNGAGTVANHGTITASQTSGAPVSYSATIHQLTALSAGIVVGGGGVSNYANSTISAQLAGVAIGAGGSVANAGAISASSTSGYGVVLEAGGSVVNQIGGLISGGHFGIADLGQFSVNNQSSATITSPSIGILGTYKSGTITNQGLIRGSATYGIDLGVGGAVTNLPGGLISGGHAGVYILNQPGTVSNQGHITNLYYLSNPGSYIGKQVALDGVSFNAGGTVTNSAGAAIIGYSYGVRISGANGTVTNAGTIASYRYRGGAGVQLTTGGAVTNSQGGLIAGEYLGVQLGHFNTVAGTQGPLGTLTFVNSGSVIAADGNGNGAAVWMYGPGTVINNQTGVIAGATNGSIVGNGAFNGVVNGGFGIVAYYQATVVNFGSIGGATYNSVAYHAGSIGPKQFAFDANNKNPTNTISNLIEIAPGSSFGGVVKGADGNGSSTLELLSSASAGSVVSFGKVTVSENYYNGYLGFGNVILDNGARWALGGTVAAGTTLSFNAGGTGALTLANPGQMQGTIANFGVGETLSLAGVTATTGVSPLPMASNDQLTVNGTGLVLQFDSTVTGLSFQETVSGGATNITVSCFATGTLILTPHGKMRVEALTPGMRAMTQGGREAEIVWVGQREVDCTRHPDPETVYPVRVLAGAFGPGLPSRDLWLSPDHAVFVDSILIPIHCLINEGTIRRMIVPQVTYYHLELPEHDVILAEDLPVESYLDTGDRDNFANAGIAARLFPDFSARMWEMAGCAPLVMTSPVLERVKRALADRRTLIAPPIAQARRAPWARLNNRYTYY